MQSLGSFAVSVAGYWTPCTDPGEPPKYLVDRILRKEYRRQPGDKKKHWYYRVRWQGTQQKTIYGFKKTFCGKTYRISSEISIGVRKLPFPLDVDIDHNNLVSSDDWR